MESAVTAGLPLTGMPPPCTVVDIFTPESSPRVTRYLGAGEVPRARALRVPRGARALEPCSLDTFPVGPLGHPPPLRGEVDTVVSGSSLSEDPPPDDGLADAVEVRSPPVAGVAILDESVMYVSARGPPPCHGMASPSLTDREGAAMLLPPRPLLGVANLNDDVDTASEDPPPVIGLADSGTAADVCVGSPSPAAGRANSDAHVRWCDVEPDEEVIRCCGTTIAWEDYVAILARTSFLDVASDLNADLDHLAAAVRRRLVETGDALEVRELVPILVAAAPARAAVACDRCGELQDELLVFTLARAHVRCE